MTYDRTDLQAESGRACGNEVLTGFIQMVIHGLTTYREKDGTLEDIEAVLEVLHILRPNVPELEFLDGVAKMAQSCWDEASHIFRNVCQRAPHFDISKALLANCLASMGDSEWKQHASEIMAGNASADARGVIRALIAREDIVEAVKEYRGGEFIIPDSCKPGAENNLPDAKLAEPPSSLPFDIGFLIRA
jgi:type III secretion protein HrpB1